VRKPPQLSSQRRRGPASQVGHATLSEISLAFTLRPAVQLRNDHQVQSRVRSEGVRNQSVATAPISSRLELYNHVPRLQVNLTDFFHNIISLSLIMRLLTSVHMPVFDVRDTFDCISVDPRGNTGGIIASEEDSSGQALAVSQEFHPDAQPKSTQAVGERIAP